MIISKLLKKKNTKGTGYIEIKEAHKSGNITLVLAISFNYGVLCYQFMSKHLH